MYREAGARGRDEHEAWRSRLDGSGAEKAGWEAGLAATGSTVGRRALPTFEPGISLATRKASQQCLTSLAKSVPSLMGGSADLTGNTGTKVDDVSQTVEHPEGRQIHFGVREHAMAAALVGAARHGGVVPFGGTFLVFADYMRPAVRLAAMSGAKCIFVWTHDSVGVGEDGPTHQPVEQVMSLRAIPDLRVMRPADATEVAGAWQLAIESRRPDGAHPVPARPPVLGHSSHGRRCRRSLRPQRGAGPDVILIGTG